jgi:hypothetical protein
MTPTLTSLDADLETMVGVLRDQRARSIDLIAPLTSLRADGTSLVLTGAEQVLEEGGVTDPNGTYAVGRIAAEHIAERHRIPIAFLRRMHEERDDIFADLVNDFIHGTYDGRHPADPSRVLLRLLQGDDPDTGIVRAILSDKYKRIDNLDVLLSVLAGIEAAGHPVQITRCDLTERRMYVQVQSDAVSVLAPDLLADYRSPYTNDRGADLPQVFAGFVISNSETGDGRALLTPRIVFQVCKNGATTTRDAIGAVHLGRRAETDGIVRWSDEALQKELELVTLRTRDAVATFLDTGYVSSKLNEMRASYGMPVDHPETAIKAVAKSVNFTDAEADLILAAFIKGGQCTAGGVFQAVTAVAQHPDVDRDRAFVLEGLAFQALAAATRV